MNRAIRKGLPIAVQLAVEAVEELGPVGAVAVVAVHSRDKTTSCSNGTPPTSSGRIGLGANHDDRLGVPVPLDADEPVSSLQRAETGEIAVLHVADVDGDRGRTSAGRTFSG
jgi:hypothetical protein